MPAKMKYSQDNLWQIEQAGFDHLLLGKTEAIMALGNGYLGTRSAEEESYVAEQRDTLVAGTFNAFHPTEVTELPNAPDMWAMQFTISGAVLSLIQGTVSDYSKRLDLRTGELTREFGWEYEGATSSSPSAASCRRRDATSWPASSPSRTSGATT